MSQSGSYFGAGGGGATVETLTGNSGGAVGPTANNINILGSGFVDVTGNPGTSTLTITIDGSGFAQDFVTDSGTATAAGDTINILGGNNISTSGAGSTVTIDVTGTTANAVQIGNASGSLTSITVGTTGELLTGATGSDPSFASSSNGDFTFTSSTAGTPRVLTITNTDNTNAASNARLQLISGGASGGDPVTRYTVTGGSSFSTGIDNTASDAYKISASTALGTIDTFIMTTAGERTMPLQPAFLAFHSVAQNNITGNNTVAVINFTTEIFDQNSDYNGTNTFTAPVTGRYALNFSVICSSVTGGTTGSIRITTSNRTYVAFSLNYDALQTASGNVINSMAIFADMDAGDTATCALTIDGIGADTVDAAASSNASFFSGHLVC